jgi:G3E family GTPase
MSANNSGLIPICLVTGFLGSGKTTFLKNIVSHNRNRKLVYIVNEFSPHDIDGAIVSKDNPDVVSIPGGSIFCKCLVTEFIGQLTKIPSAFSGVEGVVIEASGMANPKVIADMLRETKLDDRYALAHIVSIVDPGSFMKLRVMLPNIVAQVESADSVIVNKTDLYSDAIVAETATAVNEINPRAALHKCINADITLNMFESPVSERLLQGDYAKCKDPNYEVKTIKVGRSLDIEELRSRLLAVEDKIYRLKGYLPTTAGTVYAEYTKSGFTTIPVDTDDNTVVIIMQGNSSTEVQEIINFLAG